MNRREALLFLGISSVALPACSILGSNRFNERQTDTIRHLRILYTNDEHGWMEPYRDSSGVAGLMRLWRRTEGVGEDDYSLILSGGDMWTGPALSTALEGESMVDVMNQMGYSAAAIGNHDFDFGLDALHARAIQSQFPFISANIRYKDSGEVPEFVRPYVLQEVNGVNVGIIGLTTRETAVDTHPASVANIDFIPYESAVREAARQVRAEGAQLLLLTGHLCVGETRQLAPLAAELDIPLIGGGHCHEEINEVLNGVRLIESGYFLRGYTRVDMLFDTANELLIEIDAEFFRNDKSNTDPQFDGTINEWKNKAGSWISEVLGYVGETINKDSEHMARVVLDPWLQALPEAEVAMTSPRYLQQDLFPGEITVGTVMSILAVPNRLVLIELSGETLIQTIQARRPLFAGIKQLDDEQFVLLDGSPIEHENDYRVVLPEMIYGGANYYILKSADPTPTVTGIDWRDPVIEQLVELGSSRDQPLEDILKSRV